MSRYGEAIQLLLHIRAVISAFGSDWSEQTDEAIARVLALPESAKEQAIREEDEMLEEALRMNGW